MSLPTAQERIAIQKLRSRVDHILTKEQLADDWFLIRWLRAKNLNLDKAEAMIRNSMKWRAENQVDLVLKNPVDSYFATNFPFDVSGKDRDGRALVLLPIGKWNFKMAVDNGQSEGLINYFTYYYEKISESMRNCQDNSNPIQPHKQFTSIIDWEGYSFKQLTNYKVLQVILKMSSIYEDHYPGLLYQSIVINSNSFFKMIWTPTKKLMSKETLLKVQLFGLNREEWEPAVFKIVNLEKYKCQCECPS